MKPNKAIKRKRFMMDTMNTGGRTELKSRMEK